MARFRKGITAMHAFRASELVPPGFSADRALNEDESAVVNIRATSASCRCPKCGEFSHQVHSRYPRRLADLPMSGRLRRSFSDGSPISLRRCPLLTTDLRRAVRRRRSQALGATYGSARSYRLLPSACPGGRPAASFARRLSMPVSNDTLLRALRRRGSPASRRPRSLGSTTGLGVVTSATGR